MGRRLFNADVFHVRGGDHARVHHGFDFGNQPLQVFRRIHNGNHNGLILPDEAMAVDLGRLAIPLKAAKYRGGFRLRIARRHSDGKREPLCLQAFGIMLLGVKSLMKQHFEICLVPQAFLGGQGSRSHEVTFC